MRACRGAMRIACWYCSSLSTRSRHRRQASRFPTWSASARPVERFGKAFIANPDLVDYPIPGNDDAIRSILLFAERVAASGVDTVKALAELVPVTVARLPSEYLPR